MPRSACVEGRAGATAAGQVVGTSAAGAAGGVGLFGLGTIGTVAVVGGAAALTMAVIVATRDDASPAQEVACWPL